MADTSVSYKCPKCGAPLNFLPGHDKVTCEFCGSEFTIAEIEKLFAQKETKAAAATTAEHSWDTSQAGTKWEESETSQFQTFVCSSCGAELVADGNTMGGAFFQQGNVMPTAEFNFWLDPEAARTALRAPFKEQIIFPLDVCEKIRFTSDKYKKLEQRLSNPLFKDMFANHWTKPMFDKDKNFYTFVWDALAAAMVVEPSLVTEESSYPVDIDTNYGPSYGQSIAFRGYGPEGTQKARIIFTVNEDKLWDLIDRLFESL